MEKSAVDTYDGLFSQAAGEGISVFVASGDAGAAGCDPFNSLAPDNPTANSPDFLCSSQHVTCIGGTEFNDTNDPSMYWSSSNGSGLKSALGYIPEGGWNESSASLSASCFANTGPCVSGSGGGVSSFIPTPTRQKGVPGVPSVNAGRYTPDIAFSSSGHDGYAICFTPLGYTCDSAGNGGYENIGTVAGTSAAAPSMAGVAALLDEAEGIAQGNLNAGIYTTYANAPSAFHDVTEASSGVAECNLEVLSICNNSTPTGYGGVQAGYLVGAGFDEVTGLGSLDVSKFIDNFVSPILPSVSSLSISPTAAISGGTATLTITHTEWSGSCRSSWGHAHIQ